MVIALQVLEAVRRQNHHFREHFPPGSSRLAGSAFDANHNIPKLGYCGNILLLWFLEGVGKHVGSGIFTPMQMIVAADENVVAEHQSDLSISATRFLHQQLEGFAERFRMREAPRFVDYLYHASAP